MYVVKGLNVFCIPSVLLSHFIYVIYVWKLIGLVILQEILGDCGRAAIQTQGSSINPFGSTLVYGYQNIAFEVIPIF